MPTDIRTRVELKNETVREKPRLGTAGKVALIGAFPSGKQRIFAAKNFSQVVSHYDVKLNSTAAKAYNGVKAARRIFMDGISGYGGASSISCVNICTLTPTKFDPVGITYMESYEDPETFYDNLNSTVDDPIFLVNGTLNPDEAPSLLTDKIMKDDTMLSFEKLKLALNQIADEDMDILFIANDLWEVFEFAEQTYDVWEEKRIVKDPETGKAIKDPKTGKDMEEVLNTYKVPIYRYIMWPDGTPKYHYKLNAEGKQLYNATQADRVLDKDEEPNLAIQEPLLNTENKVQCWTDSTKTELTTVSSVSDITGNKRPLLHREIKNTAGLITNYEIKTDSNGLQLFFTKDAEEEGQVVYGTTPTGKKIKTIGDVYDYILDFIDNEFTTHRPVTYIGAVYTRENPDTDTLDGIPSKYIRVNGEEIEVGSDNYVEPTADNPHPNVTVWGATQIADLFTRTTNELSTCGLFYQAGIINGEEVDRTELAAHMCGFICSLPITQDLTYQTIPGLTAINEEPSLGIGDAGTILNEHGIQIIRPKDRLAKTFYVNNSVQPAGWHTNHVRSVIYLLKRLQFEDGLGMNNIITNLEAYRAVLENVCKEVMEECDVIRSVEIGDIEIISHYHIFVPINIILAGVITRINIGVSMALDENGNTTTYLKTTSGYSITV